MNRPSIYAAFGDKRALYLRAVAEYAESSRAALVNAIAAPDPLRDGLQTAYRAARDFYLAQDGRGCFLIGTAVTEANRDPEVGAIIETTFAGFTAVFAERFERAAHQGELAAHPPEALAQIATAALSTLAVRTRSGASPDVLDTLIDATVDVICAGGPPRGRGKPGQRRSPERFQCLDDFGGVRD